MNTKDFKQLLDDTHLKMCLLSSTKGEEYAGSEDRLANFKRLGAELNMDHAKVLWVYFTKHLDAIRSFLRTGRVLSEPIEERIDDAILYLILLKGIISERNGVPETPDQLAGGPPDQVPDVIGRNQPGYSGLRVRWMGDDGVRRSQVFTIGDPPDGAPPQAA